MAVAIEELWSERAKAGPAGHKTFTKPPEGTRITLSFDQGVPAPETYPVELLARYAREVVERDGPAMWEYAAPDTDEMLRGYVGLRDRIAAMITARDGKPVGRDGISLTNGSSHALAVIAAAFLGPDDGAVHEVLTFPFMVDYMAATGARLTTVPIDEGGMVVDALEDRFRQLQQAGVRPKVVYTVPSFQVPTGAVMPLERRRRLVELAQKWGVLVVEDNCYHDKWFDEPTPPTLFSLDDSGLVVQTDSFSKTIAPGLRSGHIIASPAVLRAVDGARQDLGVNHLVPRMLEAFVADGHYGPHLVSARAVESHKRDVGVASLRERCEPWVSFRVPGGGIYFWLELAPEIDVDALRAAMLEGGVACRPGERFGDDPAARRFLRMAFLPISTDELDRGIAILGKALAASSR